MKDNKKSLSFLSSIWNVVLIIFHLLMAIVAFVIGAPILILYYIFNVVKIGIAFFISFFALGFILDSIGLGHIAIAINDFFEPQIRINILIGLLLVFAAYLTYNQLKADN